ncbi:MAG: hypothetical protein K2X27_18430 [Candidatus Obscuribacterales bacterium]|nr:hypothetical protein [Candidatus Obscuribacterales bacterium]
MRIRGFAVLTSAVLLCGLGVYAGLDMKEETAAKTFEPQLTTLSLPELEAEDSPYFSRRKIWVNGERQEILLYRKDQTVVHLYFGKESKLSRVEAYRRLDEKLRLAYKAEYDASGRRLLKSQTYDESGYLNAALERHSDGSELHRFYRAGRLLQSVDIAADGSETHCSYENENLISTLKVPAPQSSINLAYWDEAKKQLRLKVKMQGNRLAGWEYLDRKGQLEHSGKALSDGSLEFSYFKDGKLRVRQLWRLQGEDWERSYYGLAYSELLADDQKSVEHKIWLHSNGRLKRHERLNAKTGVVEMRRDIDLEGRVARQEDFKADGSSQSVIESPASGPRARAFCPDGMRAYPGYDEKLASPFQLDGIPFQHSVLDRHPWSFFQVPAQN